MLHILALTDFSSNARCAMRAALQLGRCYNAEVIFLHAMVAPSVPATSPEEVYAHIYSAEKENLEQKLQHECQELYQSLDLRPKEVMKKAIVQPAPLPDLALETIAGNQVELVVMGASGTNGFKKLIMGSKTRAMLHVSPVPLLVVPPGFVFHGFQQITVVIRQKRFGNRPGLKLLQRLAHTYSATLHFILIPDDTEGQSTSLAHNLAQMFDGLQTEFTTTEKELAPEHLEKHIQSNPQNLLVWLPMPTGFWSESLSESFTKELANKYGLPLLLIPHIAQEE